MAPRVQIFVEGFEEMDEALRNFGPGFAARLMGPALAAGARVVRKRARIRGFGFTDRTGRLRKSIRVGRFGADYGGRKYRSGAARVVIGGVRGARQGHLIERGQPGTPKRPPFRGGPQRARGRETIETAQSLTVSEQEKAIADNLRRRFPRLAASMRARKRLGPHKLGAVFRR